MVPAAQAVLAPLLTACVLWSGVRATRTRLPSDYWQLGMWTGLACLEGNLWPGVWLPGLLSGGLVLHLIMSRTDRAARWPRGSAPRPSRPR